MLNFEVASFSSFQDIQKNHFVTVAADIDDSIKRKCIRVSLNTLEKPTKCGTTTADVPDKFLSGKHNADARNILQRSQLQCAQRGKE